MCGYASVSNCYFIVLGVDRPGSVAVTSSFFTELSCLFEKLSVYRCNIVICGDFNLHVDSAQCTDAAKLQHLLDSFNCKQHVTQQTHRDGHTLDLVITRTDTDVAELTVGDMIDQLNTWRSLPL